MSEGKHLTDDPDQQADDEKASSGGGGGKPKKKSAELVVRRNPWWHWLLALIGIPLAVLAFDIMTGQRIVNFLITNFFEVAGVDPLPTLENRDHIWSVVALPVGLVLALYGIKQLLAPTVMIRADADGLALRLRRPFQPLAQFTWDEVSAVEAVTVTSEQQRLSAVRFDFYLLDDDLEPWNGRVIDDGSVVMVTNGWDHDPESIVDAVDAIRV